MNKTFKGQFDTVVFMRDGKEYVVIIQEGLVYTRTKELFTGAITCELQANVIEGKFEGKWVQYYTEEEILNIFASSSTLENSGTFRFFISSRLSSFSSIFNLVFL